MRRRTGRTRRDASWIMAIGAALALIAAGCGGSDAGTASGGLAAEEGANETSDSGSDADGAVDGGSAGSADGADAEEVAPEPTDVPEQLTSEGEGEQGQQPTEDPRPGGNFTYGIASDGTGFNTIQPLNEGAFRIIGALNDPLISVDQDGNWTPFLAEDMVPNGEFTEWVMTLRPDVRFHDGQPVDADAVKANVDAFRGSLNVASALAPVSAVNVTGPLEVTFVMNQPWAAFPYTMFGQPGYMVSPATIGQNDTFVGTGAFKLQSWSPADSAVAVRNDDYWRGPELPLLDTVTWKVIPEQSARRAALEAGDVDGINGPSDSDVLDFLEDDSIDVHIGESSSNEGLIILNTAIAPTDDLRIRRAMAHAIDRQLIIDTYRSGLTIPANSFVSPTSPWFVETDYPQFDPEAAAALVAEYEAEVGPAEITILGRNSTATIEVAELVEALFEAVGIDTTIEPIAPGTEVLPVVQDNFQAIMWAQFSALDPDGQYVFFHANGGLLNWSNLTSDKLNEGFDIGRENADFDTRFEGYAMVQEALAEELPMLWMDHWSGIESVAVRPEVNGIPEVTLLDGTFVENGLVAGSYFSFEDIWVEGQS